MHISVEESGVIERKLTISVPRAEVDREIEQRLRKLTQRARLPGFRPGKAPRHIINNRYGAQVTNEVVGDTINSSYRAALAERNIAPAGLVSIEPKPLADGEDLQYVATVEVYPQIPAPTLHGRKLEKPVCEITAADVMRTLENIRKQRAEFVARAGKAQAGDRLTVDFHGVLDGQPFAGGDATGQQLILGEGRMPAEFERDLAAAEVGDAKRITVAFPEAHPAAELAGKTAEFEVKVIAVDKPILPELNAAFAEKLGVKAGGMDALREQIELNLKRELATRMRAVTRDLVLAELAKINAIEVPKGLVAAEIDRRMKMLGERLARSAPGKPPPLQREDFAAAAQQHIKLSLIVGGVVEKFSIKPDADKVRARIAELAAGYDDREAMIKWYHSDPARRRQIENLVLEEQMVECALATATVTEKKVSFAELMQAEPAAEARPPAAPKMNANPTPAA